MKELTYSEQQYKTLKRVKDIPLRVSYGGALLYESAFQQAEISSPAYLLTYIHQRSK